MLDIQENHHFDESVSSGSTSQPQPAIWGKSQPPRLIPENKALEVFLGDTLIAKSDKVIRAVGRDCGTTTFYVPREFVKMRYLKPEKSKAGQCKWRGKANYFNIDTGSKKSKLATCHYGSPVVELEILADHICFHPARINCYLDGERVWAERDDPNGAWLTTL